MDYAIAIFFLGLMVTLIVVKGIVMANDYAAEDRQASGAGKTPEKPAN